MSSAKRSKVEMFNEVGKAMTSLYRTLKRNGANCTATVERGLYCPQVVEVWSGTSGAIFGLRSVVERKTDILLRHAFGMRYDCRLSFTGNENE